MVADHIDTIDDRQHVYTLGLIRSNSMSLLSKFLKEMKVSQEFVDIYRDHLAAETLRGRIVSVTTDMVQIEKYNDDGDYDGMSLVRLCDFSRVRAKGKELELAKKISNINKNKTSTRQLKSKSVLAAMEIVQSDQGYVSIYIENIDPDICLIGEVMETDSDFVTLREYGTLKTQDTRRLIIEKNSITRIDFDGKYEKAILKFCVPQVSETRLDLTPQTSTRGWRW